MATRVVRRLALLSALASAAGCPDRNGGGRRDRVRVNAFTAEGPLAGAGVTVHDVAGAFVGSATTNDGGWVDVDVAGNELITVHHAATSSIGFETVFVRSIGGVQPGETLHFPMGSYPPTSYVASVDLDLGAGPFPGAGSYQVALAECGDAQATTQDSAGRYTVVVTTACPGDAFTPIARVLDQGRDMAFQVHPRTDLASLQSAGAALHGPWRTDFDEVVYSLSGMPAGTATFTIDEVVQDVERRTLTAGGAAANLAGVSATSGTFTLVPFDHAAAAVVTVSALGTNGTLALQRRTAPVTTIDVDFSDGLPSYLTSATIAGAPGPSVEYGWGGAPSSADYLELTAGYVLPGDARALTWVLRLPPDTGTPFVFPVWPDELADLRPGSPADFFERSVGFVDAELAGWDEARADDPRQEPGVYTRVRVERRPQ